jgi:hypothetical protein
LHALWQMLIGGGALVSVALLVGSLLLAAGARYCYTRFYLKRRLFFEPWTNLSRNESLGIGGALSELLFFELERIRKLLDDARSDSARLWNDSSALPAIERSFEGCPEFVRHTDALGLTGRLAGSSGLFSKPSHRLCAAASISMGRRFVFR